MNKGKKAKMMNIRKFKAKLMLKRWEIKESNILILNITIKREKNIEQEIKIRRKELKR
jgi:hypothetical protein